MKVVWNLLTLGIIFIVAVALLREAVPTVRKILGHSYVSESGRFEEVVYNGATISISNKEHCKVKILNDFEEVRVSCKDTPDSIWINGISQK